MFPLLIPRPRGNSVSYPVPFPSSKETSPPFRRLCLQAKFTAGPGLSLRRSRPGWNGGSRRQSPVHLQRRKGERFAPMAAPRLVCPPFRLSRWLELTSFCETSPRISLGLPLVGKKVTSLLMLPPFWACANKNANHHDIVPRSSHICSHIFLNQAATFLGASFLPFCR
jgi:hypothetical protein